MDNLKCGILTFEKYEGRRNIGSSRIRGHWLIKHWTEAEIFNMGSNYDAIIYQKAYWIDHAKKFKGVKILDVCDPDIYHWGYRTVEMIQECDAVTTSTEALAVLYRTFTNKPVICIPDRMDLESHRERKIHNGDAKKAVWFGYSTNFELLKPAVNFLVKNNLELIVISDKDFSVPNNIADKIKVTNIRWELETVNKNIVLGDFVLNPFSNTGRWQFKSNNKTLTAWALGMPVATTAKEMEGFLSEEARVQESELRLKEMQEKWDVKISVEEYKKLIHELHNKKISS
jgi:hypothetical protein